MRRTFIWLLAVAALGVAPAWAGQDAIGGSGSALPNVPVAPATVARDGVGGVAVRAVRVAQPIHLDGRLDEEIYTTTPAISDFVQQVPREGETATEQTEVWLLFDDKNIYFAARCWDSHPERDVADEMRRDAQGIVQNESIGVMFDTFHDKRNSVYFQISLAGGMRDGLGTDESNSNINWNTIWDARAVRGERSWTAEMVIPFKSLRYNPGAGQIWGVNVRRIVRWKNETSFITRVPAFMGLRGLIATSAAATMVGLEVPPSGLNFEAKPYGIATLSTDRNARPAFSNQGDGEFGADVKYGVTKSLTLDLTYNTDFAQVEDDLQQVNLTRFNLFFPERRDFFLEGQGIFTFGGISSIGGEGGAANNTPVMFFSRRIGINNSRAVPIVGGARLTGRSGAYSIGALNLQAGDEPAAGARPTNFTVVRVRRDILGRSNIGAMYTRREETRGGSGAGETFGVDALLSASRSLNIFTYLARTERAGVHDMSTLARLDYNADRYGAQLEHLTVGANFNPEVGFLRQNDIRRHFALLRFSPRPDRSHMKAVRQFKYQGSLEYIENGAGVPQWREREGVFGFDLHNGDTLTATYSEDYEFVPRPFAIASGVVVPVGGYDYQSTQVSYLLGTQHTIAGTLSYQQGSLYDGTKKTLGFATGRMELSPRFLVEPSLSTNWVDLPWGNFVSAVISSRQTYMASPRLILSALVQYNAGAHTVNTNARLRWEYQPGSELFIVYNDGRDTAQRGFPSLVNRALVVKINRLFRL